MKSQLGLVQLKNLKKMAIFLGNFTRMWCLSYLEAPNKKKSGGHARFIFPKGKNYDKKNVFKRCNRYFTIMLKYTGLPAHRALLESTSSVTTVLN